MRTVIFAIALAGAVSVAAQEAPPQPQGPVIVTSGEAVVQRTPDRAFVTIAVESRAKNPKDAQRQNAEAMAGVRERLAQARLGKDAVRTLGYHIDQDYEIVQNSRVPRDFVARNSLEVRVDDVTKVGDLIDAVVRGGATSVGGVRFDLSDRAAAEREAIRMAVADARGRAESAAAGGGVAIDRVLRIEDNRDSGGPIVRTMSAKAVEATGIEPGLIEIKAHVTLTMSIR